MVAAACGVVLTVALPPAAFWPLLIVLVPVFGMIAASGGFRSAFSLGFWFAIGFFSLYLLWLPASLSQPDWFGAFFWATYPPLLAILGVFWGLVAGVARVLGGRGRGTLLLLPAAWLLMEWGRHQGYFAFPWGTLGYAWIDTPVAQAASWVGVHGLSLLTAAVAALLAAPFVRESLRSRPAIWAPILAVLLLAGTWTGGWLLARPPLPSPDRTALLVQPNLDPFGRLGTPAGDALIQIRLTRTALENSGIDPDLVVWPEGAVIGFDLGGPSGAGMVADVQAAAPASAVILGGRGSSERGSHNSAWLLADGLVQDRYDKTLLVPFGERWPFLGALQPVYRFVFNLLQIGMLQNTEAGIAANALTLSDGMSVGVYICYESVFPQVSRAQALDGAEVLINITNDAWFARGNGARQHYDMGRMRAIETGRWLLRSGLNGITGVIDPRGTSIAELPRGIPDTMLVSFAASQEITPYVRYGGLLVPILLGWLVLGAAGRFLLGGGPD